MWRKNALCFHKSISNLAKACCSNSLHNMVSRPTITSAKSICDSGLRILTSNVSRTFSRSKILTVNQSDTHKNVVKKSDMIDNPDCNTFTYRTHTCAELRPTHEGQRVTLCGWVQFSRMSKFLLLRDGYGVTQCIVGKDNIDFSQIPLEAVVRINGIVAVRPKNMINNKLTTGEIEVVISSLDVLNKADNLPFNLRDYQKPKEQLRMQYRYLDLRFPEMQYNLRQRSAMLHSMRRFLIERNGFIEVETPTLFCRTPGGAREFVVPTHHSGLFYSLVQSPQQFKQMLMVGAVDRYFQIARCYRDESTRPDRQPEFTQLDIELSFTNRDGVIQLIEELLYETYLGDIPKPPFKRITYSDAIENYGSDKPDLTYELKLTRLTDLFESRDDNFGVYCVAYPNELGKLTAKSKEAIRNLVKKYKTKVVLSENLSREFSTELSQTIQQRMGLGNSMIVSLGDKDDSCQTLGEIRLILADLLKSKNLVKQEDKLCPLWVVDFPLFLKGQDGKLQTCHHPFTAPHPEDLHLLKTEPLKVRSLAYDIVLNGNEVGGGSVRIHNAELQEQILKMLNIDPDTLSHFLNALRCGCPPHAGLALGIDRLMAIACNAESIRDVIAFPKSHEGKDPLSGAPNAISDDDKKYYHVS